MSPLAATPGQTVGPFFGFALPFAGGTDLVPPGTPGAVRVCGRLLDGAGQPVPDSLVELWQAAADGSVVAQPGSLRRDGWTFTGWGRAASDNGGRYSFTTVEPGGTDEHARSFALTIFARGLMNRLFTRAYVPDDSAALQRDPLLSSLAPERRRTLLTRRHGATLEFDVHLQGPNETVFLRFPEKPA